jgi:hypothetical protein
MRVFKTLDTTLRHRNGEKVEKVLKVFRKPDSTHDMEVLPMYLIRLSSGTELEAFSDELVKA